MKTFLFLLLSTLAIANYLVYAILNEPKALNVWVDYGPHARTWSKYVFSSKYRSLYRYSHVTFDFVPDLAHDLPKVYREGTYTVYEVKLRGGLRWSDGTPITAEDVAFTFNSAVKFVKMGLTGNWPVMVDPGFFSHATVLDERTVRLYFKKTGIFRVEYGVLMAPIIQKKYWKQHVEKVLTGEREVEYLYGVDTVSDPDPSSGPFILKKWERGAFIVLETVRDYFDMGYTELHYSNGAIVLTHPNGYRWESKRPEGNVVLKVEMGPFVEGVLYRIFSSAFVAVQALVRGDVDLILSPSGLQKGSLEAVGTAENVSLIVSPSINPRYLAFNLDRSPMKWKAFRKAIAYLIDMDFIASRILNSTVIPIDSLVPNTNLEWYNPHVKLPGRGMGLVERWKKAVSVLKKARFRWIVEPKFENGKLVREGKGLVDPNGKMVRELILLSPNESYDIARASIAVYLENWANRLGIPVKAKLMDFKAIVEKVWYERDFDMYILGWGPVLTPEYLVTYFKSDSPFNSSHYSYREFDELCEMLLSSPTFEKAKEISDRMQMILNEDLPFIPLFVPVLYEAYRNVLDFPYITFTSGIQFLGGLPAYVRKVGD